MAETSTKPYLIRALYEWCCDNGYTPYLAVSVDARTRVPRQHVKNGEIVMNVSPLATNRLQMGNDFIEFQARFGGIAQDISVPVSNVSAIYARETGHGMAFEVPKTPAVDEPARSVDERALAEGDDSAAEGSAAQAATTGTPTPADNSPSGGEVIAFRAPGAGRRGRSGRPERPSAVPVAPSDALDDGPAASAGGAAPVDGMPPAGAGSAADGPLSSTAAPGPDAAAAPTDATAPSDQTAPADAPATTDGPALADVPAPADDGSAGQGTSTIDSPNGDGSGGGQSRPGPRRSRLTRVK